GFAWDLLDIDCCRFQVRASSRKGDLALRVKRMTHGFFDRLYKRGYPGKVWYPNAQKQGSEKE
ncbi:hypothetical protein N8542_02335, partial [Verrucomicrobia bacterium]|nr:hypothetical protein [Verrucomicrobiota bacterium]